MCHVLGHVESHSCHIDLELVFQYAGGVHPVFEMSVLAYSVLGCAEWHGTHKDELTEHTPTNKHISLCNRTFDTLFCTVLHYHSVIGGSKNMLTNLNYWLQNECAEVSTCYHKVLKTCVVNVLNCYFMAINEMALASPQKGSTVTFYLNRWATFQWKAYLIYTHYTCGKWLESQLVLFTLSITGTWNTTKIIK